MPDGGRGGRKGRKIERNVKRNRLGSADARRRHTEARKAANRARYE